MAAARHLLALLLVLALLVGHHLAIEYQLNCGIDNSPKPSSPETRVIRGEPAQAGEFPHQVLLIIYEKSGEHRYCGGIIISSRHILTAAHCVENKDPKNMVALVGSNSLDGSGGHFYELANLTIHSHYVHLVRPGLVWHDLALLKTTAPIKFKLPQGDRQRSVNRVCLPKGPVDYKMGDEFIVTGWGKTSNNMPPKQLQKLKVPYLEGKRCSAMYQKLHRDDYILVDPITQICTGGQKDDGACYGDSGGPLVRLVDGAYELVGIVSGGTVCANKSIPTFYSRVDYFLDWIEEAKLKL